MLIADEYVNKEQVVWLFSSSSLNLWSANRYAMEHLEWHYW